MEEKDPQRFSLEVELVMEGGKSWDGWKRVTLRNEGLLWREGMGKRRVSKYLTPQSEMEKVVKDWKGEENREEMCLFIYVFTHSLHQPVAKDVSNTGVPWELRGRSFLHLCTLLMGYIS